MDFLSRTPNLSGDTEEDARLILDYTVQRFDELRYYLNNLDKDNFNDVAWNNVVADIVDIAAGSITIDTGSIEVALTEMEGRLNGKIEASSNGLRTEFTDADKALGRELSSSISQSASDLTVAFQAADSKLNTDLSAKIQVNAGKIKTIVETTIPGVDGKVDKLQSSFTQQAGQIETIVTNVSTLDGKVDNLDTKVGTYNSRITQNANKIALVVSSSNTIKAASIVTAINGSGSSVTIDADHINLSGVTTFLKPSDLGPNGSTVIDGGRIDADTLTLSGSAIVGGVISTSVLHSTSKLSGLSCEVSGGQINFDYGSIKNFDLRGDTYFLISGTGEVRIEPGNRSEVLIGTFDGYWLGAGLGGLYLRDSRHDVVRRIAWTM